MHSSSFLAADMPCQAIFLWQYPFHPTHSQMLHTSHPIHSPLYGWLLYSTCVLIPHDSSPLCKDAFHTLPCSGSDSSMPGCSFFPHRCFIYTAWSLTPYIRQPFPGDIILTLFGLKHPALSCFFSYMATVLILLGLSHPAPKGSSLHGHPSHSSWIWHSTAGLILHAFFTLLRLWQLLLGCWFTS